MLLDTIFAPFVTERPICVMAPAVLKTILDGQRIDALFARTAERQYPRDLLCSSLVQWMSEVVLGVHPTVHAAYPANQAPIRVSTTALYNTLDRVETALSAALVPRLRSARRAGGQGAWSQSSALGAGLSDHGPRRALISLRPSIVSKTGAAPGPPPGQGKRWESWISSGCCSPMSCCVRMAMPRSAA